MGYKELVACLVYICSVPHIKKCYFNKWYLCLELNNEVSKAKCNITLLCDDWKTIDLQNEMYVRVTTKLS